MTQVKSNAGEVRFIRDGGLSNQQIIIREDIFVATPYGHYSDLSHRSFLLFYFLLIKTQRHVLKYI